MNIGIIGLGLIGGSIGLDLCSLRQEVRVGVETEMAGHLGEEDLNYRVLGVSRNPETCEKAIARGIVDQASVDLRIMAEADVIFLCTPLGAIAATVQQLIPHLKPTAILTDVGSVKQPIVEIVSDLWPNFVGGHPMAGTAESGIEAAQRHLFVNKPYVITPTETTPSEGIKIVEKIATLLQSNLYYCHPLDHDQAVAWISHLPVMVSASLIKVLDTEENCDVRGLADQLASSGFRDTSRVGGGNPELGLMMAKYNRNAILRSIFSYRQCLDQVIETLEQENWESLETLLTQTQEQRLKFKF